MIADLKPYPAMRDSGIPWLGEVPAHWEMERAKRLFRKMDRLVRDTDEVVTCFRDGTVTLRKNRRMRGFTESLKEIGYQGIRRGDLVIHAMDAFAGAIGVADSDGKGTPVYSACEPAPTANANYYAYTVREMARNQWIQALAKGIRERSTDFRFEGFGSQPVPVPPLPEQAAIVRFLDHADRRIRSYIRAKQKLIKLLEEQKQAIIHRAVTRGLDPNVRLKPSGVEWLGNVPEHWELSQLRRIVRRGRRITYGIVQPGEPDASGRFMVRGQDYSFGWAAPENIFRVSDAIETPYKRSRLSTGDLVLTIVGAGVGNVAIVPTWLDGANITQTTARVSIDSTKARPDFIAAVLQGPVGRRSVEFYVKGAAQPGLNLEHVRVFLVPVPPLDEQTRIVTMIQSETTPLQSAVDRANQEISLLREYRTRLIADVVTGKLDVREVAARLPDEAEEPEPLDEIAAEAEADEAGADEADEVPEEAHA